MCNVDFFFFSFFIIKLSEKIYFASAFWNFSSVSAAIEFREVLRGNEFHLSGLLTPVTFRSRDDRERQR